LILTKFLRINGMDMPGRVSSREQAENSSLESQKAELMKLGVLEENIYLEIGSATAAIENRPIFLNLLIKF